MAPSGRLPSSSVTRTSWSSFREAVRPSAPGGTASSARTRPPAALRRARRDLADDRNVARAGHGAPDIDVLPRERQERTDHLREHGSKVRTGVLRIVDLRTEERLHDADATRERGGRHEDVDPELRHIAFPDRLGEIDTGEVRAETELAADRLPHARAIESPGERVRDRVGDGPGVLVPRGERRPRVRF